MNSEELRTAWERFTENNFGLKLCPCRLRDGTRNKDLELICPCNFKIQDTWKNKDMCWCGLFFKR
jgi:ferredoxin-thioredoxin reductase catalytic subunit